MTNVVAFRPYQILGKIDHALSQLLSYALTHQDLQPDIVLHYTERLRELTDDLMVAMQRSRLEEQLNLSLELLGRSPDELRKEQKRGEEK